MIAFDNRYFYFCVCLFFGGYFYRKARDPSTSLRSGRDDKGALGMTKGEASFGMTFDFLFSVFYVLLN